jgi:hypothetical protein
MNVLKLEQGCGYKTSPLRSPMNIETICMKCEGHTKAISSPVVKGETEVSDAVMCIEYMMMCMCQIWGSAKKTLY